MEGSDWCQVFFRRLMQDLFDKCINPVGWDDKRLKDCVLIDGTTLAQQISVYEPDDMKLQRLNEYEVVSGRYDMRNHEINLYFSSFRFGRTFSHNMPCFSVEIVLTEDGTAAYTVQYDASHIKNKNNPLFRGFIEKALPFYLGTNTLSLPPFDAEHMHILSPFRMAGDNTQIQEVFDLYML